MTTRRRFIEILPLAGGALLAACSDKTTAPAPMPSAPAPASPPSASPEPAPAPAAAATGPVAETEVQAVSLGYVTDAARADKAKFAMYAVGQDCSNCVHYSGKTGDATGPCAIFQGRPVSAKGWCSAYVKKA